MITAGVKPDDHGDILEYLLAVRDDKVNLVFRTTVGGLPCQVHFLGDFSAPGIRGSWPEFILSGFVTKSWSSNCHLVWVLDSHFGVEVAHNNSELGLSGVMYGLSP